MKTQYNLNKHYTKFPHTSGPLDRLTKLQPLLRYSSTDTCELKDILKLQYSKKKLASLRKSATILSVPTPFKIVLNSLSLPIGVDIEPVISEVVSFHNKMIMNHSIIEGTARYNSIRLYAIRLMEGQNPEPLPWVATGRKDKWPSAFHKLRPLFYRVRDHKCAISDRLIRSVLYLNRLCKGNMFPDISEIIKPFTLSEEFMSRYRDFVKRKLKKSKYSPKELVSKPSLRVLRSGPNSKPKWQTAEVEAYALINSELHDSFKELCINTGNNDLYEYMKTLSARQDRVTRIKIRHIVSVPDKGNKSRMVAISDYWTQVLLQPIMTDIQSFIQFHYSNVCSNKNHLEGFEKLKRFVRPGIKSYDITSWTDAFPNTLQKIFMEEYYGLGIANAWYNLVVDCQWNVRGTKTLIKYKRGQGMGTAGSFDIATVSDLLLLEMIYTEQYKLPFDRTNVNKVGDDLWCYDPDNYVKDTYTKECGIDINISKTKLATENNWCAEFVSRNINHGTDVSRISANICRAVTKNVLDLVQLATHLEERGHKTHIPTDEIFNSLKLKGYHLECVIRTLYLLTIIYEGKVGTTLLRESLAKYNRVFILNDPILESINTNPDLLSKFKQSYKVFMITRLLNSIISKSEAAFDATIEYDSSAELLSYKEPGVYWSTDESIEYVTSRYILAVSYEAVGKELYTIDMDLELDQMIERLEHINQCITFKELGVISTGEIPWRPKATQLFNFVRSLVYYPSKVSLTAEYSPLLLCNHKDYHEQHGCYFDIQRFAQQLLPGKHMR